MDSRPTTKTKTKPISKSKNRSQNIRKYKRMKVPKRSEQKQLCNWKIGTINVLTGSDDLLLHECLRQCTRADLDICCFQELRRLGKDSMTIPITIDNVTTTWNLFWSGYKKDRRAGVGIAIKASKSIKFGDVNYISPRLLSIDLVCYGIKVRVISAYSPTELATTSQKDNFYRLLMSNCKTQKKQQLIVCGDMNATADFGKSFVGGRKCTFNDANDNGERFAQLLISNELALANSWFEHKRIHKDTWYSNTGTFSKTIDYISMSRWIMQYTNDCRVRRSYTFNNSDHRLLICRMRTPRRKKDRHKFVKKTPKTKMFDVSALKEEYIRSNFVSKVDELCTAINSNKVGVEECEKLVNILEEAAKQTLPNAVKTIQAKVWDSDEELNRLHNLRDQVDRNTNKQFHGQLTKQIRKRFDQLRNIFYQTEADKLDEAYEARNLEKLFRLGKNTTSHGKPVEKNCPGLKEYFTNHFSHPTPDTEIPSEIANPPEFIKRLVASGTATDADIDQINELIQPTPSSEEIITTIRKLKNKRASTDVPAEFLKAISDSKIYVKMVESVLTEVWVGTIIPDIWRKTTITALYKNKGSMKECKNYRGLSIGSTFLKLAMAIVLERLRPWYNKQLLPNQNGFRQFFGCPDAIFSLKSIQNISSRLNQETYLLFVDLTAAYDWCVRTWLFHSIFNRIDPNNTEIYTCIRIMEELYKKTMSNMKGETDYFETTSGVRQGGPESPNLYNLYMDYIMRVYEHRAKDLNLGISFQYRIKDQVRKRGDKNYRGIGNYYWLGYADDLVIPASSKEKLQISADLLSELFSKFGLVISIDKTKSMILNYKGDVYPDSIISINGTLIDNVEYFKYLGAIMSYSEPGTSEKEIVQRIGMANGKFSQMKKILCNYHLKLPIRMRFYDVYVRSRLLYCCETWTLTQKQLSKIETTHVGFLRRMIRGGMDRRSSKNDIKIARVAAKAGDHTVMDNIDWSYKLKTNIIYNISKSISMSTFITKQNTRWIAHVCRAGNETLTKRLMFPEEKFTKRGFHHRTVYENVIKQQEELGKSAESFLLESIRK